MLNSSYLILVTPTDEMASESFTRKTYAEAMEFARESYMSHDTVLGIYEFDSMNVLKLHTGGHTLEDMFHKELAA